ncbi:hypothetical protein AOR13_813 [Alteromonas stellipolaris LMG 21856]|nr:hypothetical protein AOR13_813 [Alteromonas stellipolaris LMG 21856]
MGMLAQSSNKTLLMYVNSLLSLLFFTIIDFRPYGNSLLPNLSERIG